MERVLRSRLFKVLVLLTCLLGCTQAVLATTVIIPSDENMIIGARAIIRGRVLSIGSSLDEQQNRIFTYITLRVQEVIKGQISARKIVIKEEGGQVGFRGSRIFGTPQFSPNEQVLLYLDTWADGSLRVHEFFLGKFSIVEDPGTGKLTVVRSAADDVVVLNNQSQSDQGNDTATEKMELSAYTAMVRSKLAANLQRSQEFEERYYHGIPVLTRPPEYTNKAKRGEIQPQYTFLAPSTPPRWFEIDSGQAVSFFVNTAGAFSSNIVSDVQAALNAWSTIPNSALRVSYAGTTDQCSPGSFNTIIFNGCDGRWSPSSGCQGTLALGGCSWYYTTKVVNGTTFYQATQGFVSMNPYSSCYFTNQDCNIQEVLTHESGHALGLGHSLDPSATMYAIAHFDGRCAKAMADDQAAMVFIYPGSGGGPGPLSITTSSLPGGTVNTAYNQSLSATGGTPAYGWSIVAGQGTLPTGLNLGAGGVVSGTPSATGTFNFTVKVTDSASPAGSAQKALSIVIAAAGAAPLDSQFVSQSVPTSVQPSQSFNVNLKFLNTGTQTWNTSPFYIASQNPALNQTWGGNAVSLAALGSVIATGQLLDVTFTVTAPSAAGTYNFQWQMYKNDGTGFFGQMSTNVSINVGSAPPIGPKTIGVYKTINSGFYLRNSNSAGAADNVFAYGAAGSGWIPLVGDWNGDGVDTIGLYNPANGVFYLRNSNSTGVADITFLYGPAGQGWIPLVGDWDGDGVDTVGLYNPANGVFYLRNSNTTGVADITFLYGPAGQGWIPLVGDWDGDGVDTVGLYNPTTGVFYLRNSNSTGVADITFSYGPGGTGWIPIVGDWNGDRVDTVGLYNTGISTFYLRNSNSTGIADLVIPFGVASDSPVVGKWN